MQRFATLVAKTDALFEKLPPAQRDGFYQLVVYPVRGSALMNEKHLSADPAKAQEAHDKIQAETRYYNEKVAGGKWNYIMSANPRKRPVFQPVAQKTASAAEGTPAPANTATQAGEPGFISFEAEKPTRATGGGSATWKTILGLGRSGDCIALLPTTESIPATAALEYDFTAIKDGSAKVLVHAIPTHAIHAGLKLRYAASVDNEPPKEVDLDTAEFSAKWSENVLRAAAIGTTEHTLSADKHTLKIRPLDPGMVFDKVVVDFGGLKPTHLGPPSR
jgi:hypothetical protein